MLEQVVLGLAVSQVAYLITSSYLFLPIRNKLKGKLGYLVTCHLCTSVWLALLVTVLDSQVTGVIGFILSWVLISLVSRAYHEISSLVTSTTHYLRLKGYAIEEDVLNLREDHNPGK